MSMKKLIITLVGCLLIGITTQAQTTLRAGSVHGTIFPFVYTGNWEFDVQFAYTIALYEPPPPGLIDPVEFILNSTPKYIASVGRYDGMWHYIPGTPKYPGELGRFNQPGLPIDWRRLGGQEANYNDTSVGPGDTPENDGNNHVGVFAFEEAPMVGNRYILSISRPGFLTRYAKVTITEDGYLGHRYLIPGDVNEDSMVNAFDVSLLNANFASWSQDRYDARFDLNADGEVDAEDRRLLNHGYLNSSFLMYMDTVEWIMEYLMSQP